MTGIYDIPLLLFSSPCIVFKVYAFSCLFYTRLAEEKNRATRYDMVYHIYFHTLSFSFPDFINSIDKTVFFGSLQCSLSDFLFLQKFERRVYYNKDTIDNEY